MTQFGASQFLSRSGAGLGAQWELWWGLFWWKRHIKLHLWQVLVSSRGPEATHRGYFWSDQKGNNYGNPTGWEGTLEPPKFSQST